MTIYQTSFKVSDDLHSPLQVEGLVPKTSNILHFAVTYYFFLFYFNKFSKFIMKKIEKKSSGFDGKILLCEKWSQRTFFFGKFQFSLSFSKMSFEQNFFETFFFSVRARFIQISPSASPLQESCYRVLKPFATLFIFFCCNISPYSWLFGEPSNHLVSWFFCLKFHDKLRANRTIESHMKIYPPRQLALLIFGSISLRRCSCTYIYLYLRIHV